jgi:hypothetical protein
MNTNSISLLPLRSLRVMRKPEPEILKNDINYSSITNKMQRYTMVLVL